MQNLFWTGSRQDRHRVGKGLRKVRDGLIGNSNTGPEIDRPYVLKILIRSGSVRGPFGVRSGSVRNPFGVCRGPFGVRSGSIQGPFGVRLECVRSVRGAFGVRPRSENFKGQGPVSQGPVFEFPNTASEGGGAPLWLPLSRWFLL